MGGGHGRATIQARLRQLQALRLTDKESFIRRFECIRHVKNKLVPWPKFVSYDSYFLSNYVH